MPPVWKSILLIALISSLDPYGGLSFVGAKVYMAVMEDDPVISYKESQNRMMYAILLL